MEKVLPPEPAGTIEADDLSSEDLALLRHFEPVLRFTRGEKFFPIGAEQYIKACSLWAQRPNEKPVCLVPERELTLERLGEGPVFDATAEGPDGAVYYLKYADPLNFTELALQHWQRLSARSRENGFQAGRGRLARVGYFSRFIDAMFSLSLLARGRVSGDSAAAAALGYHRVIDQRERYRYYGRVLRQDGWLVLQYWYFYFFNDWRSGFFGTNDHEADWEMINLYLSETATGQVTPEWVAYASHDRHGDDLRRRWDDPEVEKVGERPVVYVGAGSHACYFAPGEYVTELVLPLFATLDRIIGRLRQVWYRQLRQYRDEEGDQAREQPANIFHIPFIDYARGDGLSIGVGGDKRWERPHLLTPPPAWVTNYRGLWGLYAQDPFAGEDAPAGPMYNRDGSVRKVWYDPVGWAGLDKVPPPQQALAVALNRQEAIRRRRATLLAEIEEKSQQLKAVSIEAAAVAGEPDLQSLHDDYQQQIDELVGQVDALRTRLAQDEVLLKSLARYADRLWAGERGPLRAHIRRAHQPASDEELRIGRVAEFWAATSIGLMLIGFVAIFYFAREYLFSALGVMLYLVLLIEATFRRRLNNFLGSIAVALALLASGILLFEFFWEAIVLIILVAGVYILWENLRELWT